jgi:hypothetical protein
MGRVDVRGTKDKESAAERRRRQAREAAAAAAAEAGPARRGEDDDQETSRNESPADWQGEEGDQETSGNEPPAARAEVPGQATGAAPAVPAPGAPAPAAPAPVRMAPPLPDLNATPADQLTMCERHIHDAKARWKARIDGATEAFVDEAGPYLAWVHEHKLYKLMRDSSGKVYRSFPKYLREEHDLSERTGYRITQTIPLLRVLADGGHPVPDLSARQVGALHPVRLKHGAEAVLRVWSTASETKKGALPTPEELEKAKTLLELVAQPDVDDEEPRALTAATDPGAVVERAAKLLVPATVREAVRKDPERVRDLVRVLSAALDEAGAPVD